MRRLPALTIAFFGLVAGSIALVPSLSSFSRLIQQPAAGPTKSFLGLFFKVPPGDMVKVGYTEVVTEPAEINGKPGTRSRSKSRIKIDLLGANVEQNIDSMTESVNGRPVRMTSRVESAGRYQTLEAVFGDKKVKINTDNNGTKLTQELDIPTEGTIVDDPLNEFVSKKVDPGTVKTFWILDPTTASFVKNTLSVLGVQDVEVRGKTVRANALKIDDPRMALTAYISDSGEMVKASTAMGFEMWPITEEEALAKSENTKQPDLADLTSIKTTPVLKNPADLLKLKMRLTVKDLKNIPSDEFQSAKKDGNNWIIDVHPQLYDKSKSISIAKAGAQKREWTKSSLNIPSDSRRFRDLAKKIIGKRTDVKTAAAALRGYVYNTMHPNAGIGVLRDANEVLDSREGVCRDYAILMATLCRAAGIPTRLVSGLVNWDGPFYYHAWVEVWTGYTWLPFDATYLKNQVSAAHVKLAQGNVDSAFTFTVLGGASIDVLGQTRTKK